MTVTQASMSYILDEVVSAVAFESFFEMPFHYPQLFSIRGSSGRRERFSSIGGIGQFQSKAETVDADTASISQQFQKTFLHTAYALQIPVSRELIDDEDWGFFQDLGTQLGTMAAQTMEVKAAEIFENAFTSTLSEDGLTLCNSAHVNVDSGNSQDNSGTNTFGMAGIKATRTAMRKFTNYSGEKIAVNPDSLLVPVDIEEDAWEAVRSSGRPDTANRAENMYNGMFRLFVWPFLSDTNNWFMMDSRLMAMHLLWFQRTPLEVFGDGNLFSGTRKIGAYYRESHGARDWRWLYGNLVS